VISVDEGWELRYGDQLLATLGNPTFEAEVECVTRDGEWVFTRLRGGNTEASTGAAIVARYRSNVLPGGRIELGDGTRLRLRPPPPLGETWRVRRGRDVVLALSPTSVEFGPAARELHELPLVTMLAIHARLTEVDRPSGGGGGDGGTGF
jgi:hypothetical protein